MEFLIGCLLFLATVSGNLFSSTITVSALPMADDVVPTIVGGQPAKRGQFPFQVSFQVSGSHMCGGSIMDKNTVITAAHCCYGSSAGSVSIVAGILKLSESGGGQRVKAKQIRNHPKYQDSRYPYDICIVKLQKPLNFIPNLVGPVSLPQKMQEEPVGPNAVVSGWGSTIPNFASHEAVQLLLSNKTSPSRHQIRSNEMRWVQVPFVSDKKCREPYGNIITDSMICAGEGGKDSCQGDSGGPLVQAGTNKLIGVVSFGAGCGRPGYPGVYTQVSYFLDWLKANSG